MSSEPADLDRFEVVIVGAGVTGIGAAYHLGANGISHVILEAAGQWRVYTNRGIFVSRFLLNANGYFSGPYVPAFKDLDTFSGEIFHAFELDGGRTFEDKDVVLVGSGAIRIRTGEIDRFTETSVVLEGGEEIKCDVCVTTTAFARSRSIPGKYRSGRASPPTT